MPASQWRSPAPSTNFNALFSQIDAVLMHSEAPSTSELNSLSQSLNGYKRSLEYKLANLKKDEQDLFDGKLTVQDVKRTTLQETLDSNVDVRARDLSPALGGGSSRPLHHSQTRSARSRHSASSPGLDGSRASPTFLSHDAAYSSQRAKVKREMDRERSIGVASIASGSGSHLTKAISPGLDADWEEEGPARPGRTYYNKKKRNRVAGASDQDSGDEVSQSDLDSPMTAAQRASGVGDSSWSRRESMFSNNGTASAATVKLRLNPFAQTALAKRDLLSGSMMRRPSGMRIDDLGNFPLTPFQVQQAAMWELPRLTPETFLPKRQKSRPSRLNPIKPEEVDVDFASMDWKERDRERERVEALVPTETNGIAPGQTVIKDSAISRARDRKGEQVSFNTFQQWADGWFRTLTEEDLAWLDSRVDDLEVFSIPHLGKYYREIWEEEESLGSIMPTVYLPNAPYSTTPLKPASASVTMTQSTLNGLSEPRSAHTPAFDPRQLKDDHLFAGSIEDVRSGPFTERLLSALLPTPPPSDSSQNNSQQNPVGGTGALVLTGGHGGGNAGAAQNMADYEIRLMRELKAISVLGEDQKIDWSSRTDDEISSTLRKVQRLLRKQIRLNESRKMRLYEIAKDRMGYQDYLACLNSVEREIESGWLRRQTQIRKSIQAQKKKKGGSSGSGGTSSSAVPAPAISGAQAAALGAGSSSIGGEISAVGSPAAAGTPGATGQSSTAMTVSASQQQNGSATTAAESTSRGGPMKPQFSEALLNAMERRRQLKYAIEPIFADKPLAKFTPYDAKDESVYKEIDSDFVLDDATNDTLNNGGDWKALV